MSNVPQCSAQNAENDVGENENYDEDTSYDHDAFNQTQQTESRSSSPVFFDEEPRTCRMGQSNEELITLKWSQPEKKKKG